MEELKKLAMERQTPKLTLKAAFLVSEVCIAQALSKHRPGGIWQPARCQWLARE